MGSILIDGHSLSFLEHKFGHRSPEFYQNQIIFAKHYEKQYYDMLPHTVFWDWLKFRHDLDPKRFDYYHPCDGRLIERSEHHIPIVPVVPPIEPPGPSMLPSGSVPEPGTIVLLAASMCIVMLMATVCRAIWRAS